MTNFTRLLPLIAVLPVAHAIAIEPLARTPFMTIYANTCMHHADTPDGLRAEMVASKAPVLETEMAQYFLGGNPGRAWRIESDSRQFVVALREDGLCGVYARQADPDAEHRAFVALVSKAPPPLVATPVTPPPAYDTAPMHTAMVSWSRPADRGERLFTLTTTTDETAPAQAQASVAMTAKPDPADADDAAPDAAKTAPAVKPAG